MDRLFFLLLLVLMNHCKIERTIDRITQKEEKTLKEFHQLDSIHQLQIAKGQEPGEKLLLCLTFVDKADKKTLPNQIVEFFHTTEAGNYEPTDPNDESTARLSGRAITDNSGRIFVKTILPGNYGSGTDNRHIHTTVIGAKPEAYDIIFKLYTSYLGNIFRESGDQHFFADLKKTNDDVLIGFLTVEVKKPILSN